MSIKDVSAIFNNNCNYKNINKISPVKMRQRKDGLKLLDALNYRFLYTFLGTTQESVSSKINFKNDTSFDRQTYNAKEGNIPTSIYSDILRDIKFNHDSQFKSEKIQILSADGTYNRDSNYNEIMNMGLYDVTNDIPVSLESFGKEGKNNEIRSIKKIISREPVQFASVIIVVDRAYFCYKLIKYLVNNNIKFVIRVKGEASNLLNPTAVPKSDTNYKDIQYLHDKIRIVKCESIYDKTVHTRDPKKKYKRNVKLKQTILTVKNDCVLVTNLLDDELYSDAHCLELYKSRWDVEVFFKLVKETYKFSYLTENDSDANKKTYLCIMAIELIMKIIIKLYLKMNNKVMNDCKVNHSNLAKGLIDTFLINLIYNDYSDDQFLQFCKAYIKFFKITKDRIYPRVSKKPFTKWYIKQYSISAEINKIIKAIETNCFDKLNKNLRSKANKILKINNIDCSNYKT